MTRTRYTREIAQIAYRRVSASVSHSDIKGTALREVSNFIVAFPRKKVFVRNLNPYRLLFQPLIVRFGYR